MKLSDSVAAGSYLLEIFYFTQSKQPNLFD